MARKNPFENLLEDAPESMLPAKTEFTARGASRSISSTLDDLAAKADQLLEGETIVELDPKLIDPSFLKDRIEDDNEEFQALKKAILEEGQSTPILVRPHPNSDGRYMVVFGSRRRKAAEELSIKVRAVVKEMGDRDHAVAQGQENAARANLSFIERTLLAAKVVHEKYDDDNSTVMSALSIDKATLSKMLSVAKIPGSILKAVGAAKGIGRDRWYELKTLLDRPGNMNRAEELIKEQDFLGLASDKRFESLLGNLKRGRKTTKSLPVKPHRWVPKDKGLAIDMTSRGKSFSISVKAKDQRAIEFGEYLSKNLESIYNAFKDYTEQKEE